MLSGGLGAVKTPREIALVWECVECVCVERMSVECGWRVCVECVEPQIEKPYKPYASMNQKAPVIM